MLLEFSVENFKSIKDKVTLSMMAGKEKENIDNIMSTVMNKENALKYCGIYGANASGKSNIIKAFTTAIIIIRTSNNRQINELLPNIIPFKFDKNCIDKPSKFQFIFETNGKRYVYGFSATAEKIVDEYLYQYNSAKPTKIFVRTNTNNYDFTSVEKSKLDPLKDKNNENKLLLATATEWNYEKTKEAYMWFANQIDTMTNDNSFKESAFKMYENDKSGELKKFTLNFLKEAEINIDNYDIKSQEVSVDQIIDNIPDPIAKGILEHSTTGKGIARKVTTSHKVKNNEYFLSLNDESLGTQIIFFLCPILYDAFKNGKTLIIDEIEKSLHTSLVRYIVELFHNININKNKSQLIFSTHDTNLLTLDLFRRDQIYFTEKDFETGATDLYSLDEFSVRKNENIKKGYLQGRYGAIPAIGLGDDLWK